MSLTGRDNYQVEAGVKVLQAQILWAFFVKGGMKLFSLIVLLLAELHLTPLRAVDRLEVFREFQTPRLQIDGVPGNTYSLFTSTNLESGVWETFSTFLFTNQTREWIYNSVSPIGFFRSVRHSEPWIAPSTFNFRLTDHKGFSTELLRGRTNKLVLLTFLDVAAEGSKDLLRYLHDLKTSQKTFPLSVWVVDSNPLTRRQEHNDLVRSNQLNLLLYLDPAGIVANTYGARKQGESFLLEMESFTQIYQGLLTPSGKAGLLQALENYKAQQPILLPVALGESPRFASLQPGNISYVRDVAPILIQSCVRCHSEGNIGSFSMTNHAIIRDYSISIRSQLLDGHMPPWHADPKYQEFANDFSLSEASKSKLIQWIQEGSVQDEGTDPLTTNIVSAVPWPLGQPDYIIKLPKQFIPASGTIEYRYLSATSPFTSNVWVRAAVIKPGNRKILHHCLSYFVNTNALSFRGLDGFFAGYVPGTEPHFFPENTGKFLPKDQEIEFQLHYTAIGATASDETEIGFYLMPEPPQHELKTRSVANVLFRIPPGVPDHEVWNEVFLEKKVRLFEMSPHMHHRGSRFRFEAVYPNGVTEVLLSVPNYEFQWQILYRMATPKDLPAGTVLRCVGAFDNSTANHHNPNPKVTVRFGEQSWDEMFVGYYNFIELE